MTFAPEVWTVVVAGGSGTRFGKAKQYIEIGGRRVLDRAVDTAAVAGDGVVVVVPAADAERERAAGSTVDAIVAGGGTRRQSVANGLAAIPGSATIIVVHDAARPFASLALFAAVIDAVRAGADGAVPGVAVTDSVKRVAGGRVVGSVPRDDLVTVQTPQAFRAGALRAAHAAPGDPAATDDSALVEAIGGLIVVVPGEAANRKITEPDDLAWAEVQAGSP